jgi:hypothetical protein
MQFDRTKRIEALREVPQRMQAIDPGMAFRNAAANSSRKSSFMELPVPAVC